MLCRRPRLRRTRVPQSRPLQASTRETVRRLFLRQKSSPSSVHGWLCQRARPEIALCSASNCRPHRTGGRRRNIRYSYAAAWIHLRGSWSHARSVEGMHRHDDKCALWVSKQKRNGDRGQGHRRVRTRVHQRFRRTYNRPHFSQRHTKELPLAHRPWASGKRGHFMC